MKCCGIDNGTDQTPCLRSVMAIDSEGNYYCNEHYAIAGQVIASPAAEELPEGFWVKPVERDL